MIGGTTQEVLSKLEAMDVDKKSLSELRAIVDVLGPKGVRIDFSILDGMKYYNGIVFRGYVQGVPVPVISGGQYDKLMKRMKKNCKAIGFAVYLDSLERLVQEVADLDVDVVVKYSDKDDVGKVLAEAQRLREGGKTVVALKNVPDSLRYGQLVEAGGEDNA